MYKYANPSQNSAKNRVLQTRLNNVLSGTDTAENLSSWARSRGVNLGAEIKKRNLSGADLAKLTPQGYGAEALSFRDNMRALGHQTRSTFSGGVRGSAKNVYTALKRGMTESGGGFRGGVGNKMRYLPMGAKAGAMTSAIPELAGAFKKEDPTGQGRSQTERVGRAVGSVAGGLLGNLPASVTNRLGLFGSMAGGMGATMLGSAVGAKALGGAGKLLDKGVSKVRGVEAGDVTHQGVTTTKRSPGTTAV